MALSRKARTVLILLAVPLVLVLAGFLFLKIYFTDERLREMVIPRAEAALGRKVSIQNFSLSVLPSIALEMQGVEVANRAGEGFSPTPLLSLDALRLHVKLLPLIRSRIEVTSMEMDGPRILLEVNRRNQTNYADLAGRQEPAPAQTPGKEPAPRGPSLDAAPAPEPSSALALLVSELRVSNGVFEYVDHRQDAATRIRGITLTTQVAAAGDSVLITGTATGDSLSYGTVTASMLDGIRLGLQHRMLYAVASDLLIFERGDLSVQDMLLNLGGTISGLRGVTTLNLTVGSDSVNIADLFSLIPKEYSKKAEGLRGTGTARVRINVTGTLTDTTTSEIRGTIASQGAQLQYPDLPKPISDITIRCSFIRTAARQEIQVEDFTAALGGTPVRARLSVIGFDDPSLSLSAAGSLDLATVREYYPLEQGTDLAGRMKADIQIAGRLSDPAAMRASGLLAFTNVVVKTATSPTPIRNLNGTVTFTNQFLESKHLALAIGKSDMTLNFRVVNYLSLVTAGENSPRPRATMTLQSSRLYASDIMSETESAGTGSQGSGGRPHAGGGTTPAQQPPATGEPTRPAPQAARKAQPSTGLPLPDVEMDITAAIGTLTTEKFVFTNVRGSMKIVGGIITMQNLTMNVFGGSVVTRGTLSLQHPDRPLFDLSLDLNALQAGALLPHFTSFGQRLNGSLTMNTTLKGALDDTLGLIPSTLDGAGKVGLQNGTLQGFRVNQSLASTLNLPDLETVAFKDWTNAFSIRQGRFVVKDLRITALNAEYVVNGSQGLDGSLDYAMTVFLPPSVAAKVSIPGFAGEAVNLFKDETGRLKLDFSVGGTTDAPKLQLDTSPAKQRAEELAKQKLQEEKKKLEESLKEKAGDALRKLLKPK